MRVLYGEGVANHTGPESCGGTRKGAGEALTGEHVGRPLSRDSTIIPGADVVVRAEGNTRGRANASARTARRGRRPRHAWTLLVREPGDLLPDRPAWAGSVRIGKAGGRRQ